MKVLPLPLTPLEGRREGGREGQEGVGRDGGKGRREGRGVIELSAE